MRFTKMEGLGNDYIYLNCMQELPPNLPRLAAQLSHRRFGVGADGLICIRPGKRGDFTMEMYNADGSRGEMCGNGIRCVGKYVYDNGLTKHTDLTIETAAGPRRLLLHLGKHGRVEEVTVDMGAPGVFRKRRIRVEAGEFEGIPVSMGNPHYVIFCSNAGSAPVLTAGPQLERHSCFPKRTNVEFLQVENPHRLRLRVWERGSGETMACGTGACACFAVARQAGQCGDRVVAALPGGELELNWSKEGHILMKGPARTVFEGEIGN